MKKVVFFDRDGTVIVDPPDGRVTSESKIKLFPDSAQALNSLANHGYSVILITNQNGIAEGRISVADFDRINAEVIRRLEASSIKILNTYMCPHGPNGGCVCRKPQPTMVLQAIKDYKLDAAKTFMVGDHRFDVLAGKNAGTKTIHVKTANMPEEAPEADFIAQNLTEAVDYVIANS